MQTREDFLPLSLPAPVFIITWPSQEALPFLPRIPVWIREINSHAWRPGLGAGAGISRNIQWLAEVNNSITPALRRAARPAGC